MGTGMTLVFTAAALAGVLLLSGQAEAWPNGAPTSVCMTLMPGHGTEDTDLAYEIDIGSNTNYNSGTPINVMISRGSYQGFILQARNPSSDPVGTFSDPPAETKVIECGHAASTMTHSSMVVKNGVSFTWNPPESDEGDVYFVATVAELKNSWKRNIRSGTLPASGYNGSVTPATDHSGSVTFRADSILTAVLVFAALQAYVRLFD